MGNITNWYVEIIWLRSNVPNVNFAVFLRCQFDPVKLVCYKRNNSWLQENKQFLFECSTRYSSSERSERVTSSWTRKETFHISKQPVIILFIVWTPYRQEEADFFTFRKESALPFINGANNISQYLYRNVLFSRASLNGVLFLWVNFLRREETGVPGGNPRSQVEIDWNSIHIQHL